MRPVMACRERPEHTANRDKIQQHKLRRFGTRISVRTQRSELPLLTLLVTVRPMVRMSRQVCGWHTFVLLRGPIARGGLHPKRSLSSLDRPCEISARVLIDSRVENDSLLPRSTQKYGTCSRDVQSISPYKLLAAECCHIVISGGPRRPK